MALEFPNNPADGELSTQPNGVTYEWDAAKTRWLSVISGGGSIVAGTVVQVHNFQTSDWSQGSGNFPVCLASTFRSNSRPRMDP